MGSYGGCRALCAAPHGPREEARQCPFSLHPGFRAFGRLGEARRQHTDLWRTCCCSWLSAFQLQSPYPVFHKARQESPPGSS